VLNENRF
jgi:hypothetical protein